jgi:shikimate kinase
VAEHVLLVGMMGAGKSTVGRLVAQRLGRPHIDTDELVERDSGRSVAAIFSSRGEAWFRVEEWRVLASVLADTVPAVVSVGGGAVLDPVHRVALRDGGTVVWLRARPETLARRVARSRNDRPLLAATAGGPAAALARIEVERRPMYQEVAAAVVDVDDLTPRDAAERVVALVEAAPGEGDS